MKTTKNLAGFVILSRYKYSARYWIGAFFLLTCKYSAAASRSVALAFMFSMGSWYIHLVTSSRMAGLSCSSSILRQVITLKS